MSLAVLTDAQIKALLEDLTLDELESFRNALKATLHEYSTSTQAVDDSEIHQPQRTSITSSRTGATTLFMPSSSRYGVGVKGNYAPWELNQQRSQSLLTRHASHHAQSPQGRQPRWRRG